MKKILIVDDSAFMRGVLKDLLAELTEEIEIHEAEDKSTALKQLKTVQPNLVLLDIVMKESETEGVEILKEVRRRNPKAKVIMITSIGQDAIVEECRQIGAVDYIEKPFNRESVLKSVSVHLI